MLQHEQSATACLNEYGSLTSLAYDGSGLYTALPQFSTLLRLEPDGRVVSRHTARRRFCALCYDTTRSCFWAVSRESPLYLYRLNANLQEEGRIRLQGGMYAPPSAIACDGKGGFWVAADDLLAVDACGCIISRLPLPAHTLSLSSLGSVLFTGGKGIQLRDGGFNPVCALGEGLRVQGVATGCVCGGKLEVFALTREDCYNCLRHYTTLPPPNCEGCQNPPAAAKAASKAPWEQLLLALLVQALMQMLGGGSASSEQQPPT